MLHPSSSGSRFLPFFSLCLYCELFFSTFAVTRPPSPRAAAPSTAGASCSTCELAGVETRARECMARLLAKRYVSCAPTCMDGSSWEAEAMGTCFRKGTVVGCTERERHFGVILEELNAGFDAVRVSQKEMCESKERLKNAHEDKAEVIQLIPRHRTTEYIVVQPVDVPIPVTPRERM